MAIGERAAGSPPERMRRPRPAVAAALAIALAALASAAASWQCWINPFVDAGREMDVPARLAAGERLYRDVDFYYGPVGPWMAAAAVRLAGRHWWALEALNAALAAAILALLYRLTARAGSARTALAATAFAAAFVIGAPSGGAYLFPYSSDNLFALAGALLAIDSVSAPGAAGSWRGRAAGALGLATALAARLELGLAIGAILLACGLLLPPRGGLAAGLRESFWRIAGGAAAALAAYAVAFAGLPLASLTGAGPLTHFLALPPEWSRMYAAVAGFAHPGQAMLRLGGAVVVDAALLAAAAFSAAPRLRWPAGERGRQLLWGLLVLAGTLLLAMEPRRGPDWRAALPPLLFPIPLVAAGSAVWTALGARRLPVDGAAMATAESAPPAGAAAAAAAVVPAEQESGADPARPIAASDRQRARFLLFAATALVSARVALGFQAGPTMGPYSAVPLPLLAATACVLACEVLGSRLPDPPAFRRRLAAVLAAAALLFLYQLARLDWRASVERVATPAGALRLRAGEAVAVEQAIAYLAAHARPGDALATFPEGGFFNFVTGLPNPLREEQVFPGVLDGPGELAAARRLELARPRFILLCSRPTREYGPIRFGADYARELWGTVERLYAPTEVFGRAQAGRPGARRFFIRLFEPRLSPPASVSGNPWEAETGSPAASAARRP